MSGGGSNAVVNGLAGAGGGIVAQILTYPLQTVNTRQQTERVVRKGVSLPTNPTTSDEPRNACRQSTIMQIIQVIRREGWGGLYSGLKPSLFGTAASQGIYYYFYQAFKNKAEAIAIRRQAKGHGSGQVGMFGWLIVAALAGCLNVLFTSPIWVIVTRMQTYTQSQQKILARERESISRSSSEDNSANLHSAHDHPELTKLSPYGTWHAVREVYDEAGIAGFWKGIIPTLIMVCNPSIQFMIYESLVNYVKARRSTPKTVPKNLSSLEVFLFGAIAKLGATVCTYPLLVVKSRLQANQDIGGSAFLKYSGTFDAIRKMIRYEGLPGFYKGMGTKIVQSVFAASVLFMMKEELVKAYLVFKHREKQRLSKAIK